MTEDKRRGDIFSMNYAWAAEGGLEQGHTYGARALLRCSHRFSWATL